LIYSRQLTKLLVIRIIMSGVDDFEWDYQKAVTNYAKHGVSFDEATLVFRDPFGIEKIDDREGYGELS
jgi:uncharacterized protein